MSSLFERKRFLMIMGTIAVLSAILVIVRMKTVDLHYEQSRMSKKIQELDGQFKELRANKARLLSVKNLREIAAKFNLSRPGQEQIIVIP